jgi:hypothetical protein
MENARFPHGAHLVPAVHPLDPERLLQTVTILARVNGEGTVGGVLAYRCLEHGHIFFLREADVSAPFPASTNA